MSSFSFPDWGSFLDQGGARAGAGAGARSGAGFSSSSSSSSGAGSSSSSGAGAGASSSRSNRKPGKNALSAREVLKFIKDIDNPRTRDYALLVLSKNRGTREELAPLLWESKGTVFILLQELTSAYRVLPSPELVGKSVNNVCNTLALFQCVAANPETRMNIIKAGIPYYLYPFIGTTNKERPYEYLRVSSLGVIGALVKTENPEIVRYLLESELIPLCLRCMEVGSELSKTVATFIIQKILLHDEGLRYFCSYAERFFALARVMGDMVDKLVEEPSKRLLKHIIRVYARLSECPRACDAFKVSLPIRLKDSSILSLIRDDLDVVECLGQLYINVATRSSAASSPATGDAPGSSPSC